MTNDERIYQTLKEKGPLCDDCLSDKAGVSPRNSVNQICRKRAKLGHLDRKEQECPGCKKKKIINILTNEWIADFENTFNNTTYKINFLQGKNIDLNFCKNFNNFLDDIKSGEIEIYNEVSLQLELGIFLRENYKKYKVQFERNVSFFGFDKSSFIKKEIDISLFGFDASKNTGTLEIAIELKYPRNGRIPETMYDFCRDIVFLERLVRSGFSTGYAIIFADNPNFYKGNQNGIYGYFRYNENSSPKNLTGEIKKPTGDKNESINIEGNYLIEWKPLKDKLKYAIIEIS